MGRLRWVSACLLVGSLLSVVRPHAQGPAPQASFHGIGDLEGGQYSSQVRDAVKIDGVIYAVGGGSQRFANCTPNCPNLRTDTAVLWTFDGTTASLVALPRPASSPDGLGFVAATDITADALNIASRAQASSTNPVVRALRLDRESLSSAWSALDLTTVTNVNGGFNSSTVALSSNGGLAFVNTPTGGFRVNPGNAGTFAVSRSVAGETTFVSLRGSSADAAFVAGFSIVDGEAGSPPHAVRAEFGGPDVVVTSLDALPGGSWNQPIAISSNGQRMLLVGDSAAYPEGELYLQHFDATTPALVRLGSPNSFFGPWGLEDIGPSQRVGGQTEDGSVAVVSFGGINRGRYGYFHNQFGWFHLTSALAAEGVHIRADGWSDLTITGISADGTLVFGTGMHNDFPEGFVAEFAPGYLRDFNPPAVPPSDMGVVGVWTDNVAEPEHLQVFMKDGTYFQLEDSTFERGLYTWNGSLATILTKVDTNGDAGVSDDNGNTMTIARVGNTLIDPESGEVLLTRLDFPLNGLAGGWVFGDPTRNDQSGVFVLLPSGRYFMGEDGDHATRPGGHDGGERGTLHWDPATGAITNIVIDEDTNGEWGFSHIGSLLINLSADGLGALLGNGTSVNSSWTRIIDPTTVLPNLTSVLAAPGVATVPFSYTITADHAVSFNALDLPNGLAVNPETGVISGTPTVAGIFDVTISATNTFGASDSDTLVLSIDTPNTPVSPTAPVTIEPDVPPGADPVAITFTAVTAPGETTVTPVDPMDAPPPPANFMVGTAIYDVHTTATVVFPATVCLSTAGATGTPRLFHFEGGSWIDITIDSPAPPPGMVCGSTQSFSLFGVMVSPIVKKGFFSPVTMTDGFVNTVKGGSTVPLKFTVTVNGVEKTTTDGLQFNAVRTNCDAGDAEDPVDFTTTGSGLRYDADARMFIQNWQVPRAAGACYIVRVTSTADGVALNAVFRVK